MRRRLAVAVLVLCVSGVGSLSADKSPSVRERLREYRVVLRPLDVHMGPEGSTGVVGRLGEMSLVHLRSISGDGEWARVWGFGGLQGTKGGVLDGWVPVEVLRRSAAPVEAFGKGVSVGEGP